MKKCCKCRKRIWWWQAKGFNSLWHKLCAEVWEDGYETARRYADNENELAGYKTAGELYRDRMYEIYRPNSRYV